MPKPPPSGVTAPCKSPGMTIPTLEELVDAIAASWSRETSFASEEFMSRGASGNPSRGQCGPTSLVVQDWFGGSLLVTDVFIAGASVGAHYWNRLPDSREVDLTRRQFLPDETLGEAMVTPRVPKQEPAKGLEQYRLLQSRVRDLVGEPRQLA